MSAPAAIPVIDLATATGDELVAGLQKNSCVFLTGLGTIPAELEAMLTVTRTFFDQSEEQKSSFQWNGTGKWQGWQPVYSGKSGAAPMERFEVALPDPADFPTESDWLATFALWPTEPEQLRATWARYYRSMRELSSRLVTLISEPLGLSPEDLTAWTTRQASNLCVNHYLAQNEPPPDGQERQRPHTDIGGLTLLWGENTAGGLHAQLGPDGAWVPVEFPENSFLLQAGDLLHLLSGGTIPANFHRVVNPPRTANHVPRERYSVVFFHHPDLDSWVAPTLSEAPGVNAREHVLARQSKAYQA
jgi:isopenicillin N synthase-like dioxygenase